MPRFVVLRHEMPTSARAGVHWDLMLEDEGRLRTWALANEPEAGIEIVADALADHRLDYLQYEGPISRDRGEVRRWDEGTYELLRRSADELAFKLNGNRLVGDVVLDQRHDALQRWRFVFSPSS